MMRAAPCLLHVAARDLVGVDRGPEVGFERLLELLLADVLRCGAALDARDVGEHVETAEPLDAALHHLVELGRPDVAVLEEHVTAERRRRFGHLRAVVGVDVHREHRARLRLRTSAPTPHPCRWHRR